MDDKELNEFMENVDPEETYTEVSENLSKTVEASAENAAREASKDLRENTESQAPRQPVSYTFEPWESMDSSSYAAHRGSTAGRETQASSGQGGSDRTEHRSYDPIPPEPAKKRGGFWKKALGVVLAGLLLGVIAFGTFRLMDHFTGTKPAVQTEAEAAAQTEAAAPTEAAAATEAETVAQIPTQSSASAQMLDVSGVVDAAMPTVVAITNELEVTGTDMWGRTVRQASEGSGSGVIIDQTATELLIVTNAHVVQITGSESSYYDISSVGLKVTFCDGQEVEAYLKGSDSDADLAVMAVSLKDIPEETLKNIAVSKIGSSDDLRVGNGVIAIGNALGFGQSVTVGYVSALNRDVTIDGVTRTLLQTDAAINPGNSGGALLNVNGELVGINSAKYSEESVEGMGYAIPISQALGIIDNLKTMETKVIVPEAERGYLGIRGATVDSNVVQAYGVPAGIYVSEVMSEAPAAQSELKARDIITAVDGTKLSNMSDLQSLLRYYRSGQTVKVTVQRQSEEGFREMTFDVELASRDVLERSSSQN